MRMGLEPLRVVHHGTEKSRLRPTGSYKRFAESVEPGSAPEFCDRWYGCGRSYLGLRSAGRKTNEMEFTQ